MYSLRDVLPTPAPFSPLRLKIWHNSDMSDAVNIVFDIGGTNMRVAAADGKTLRETRKIPTPKDPADAVRTLCGLAREIAGEKKIAVIVGCSRWIIADGVFLPGDDVLSEWGGTHLVGEISKQLGAPVRIVHDTAAIGLGEVHAGAGQGSKICAYVTVSTGVGGDRIVDGNIDQSTYNPEIGRQLIDGEELGNLVSGVAVRKKFGIEPKDLESIEERNKLADILAIGLYNTALHWSPDTIVLGGSMITGMNPIPLARVESELAKRLDMYPKAPVVKMAELGDIGGLVGAAILAEKMLSSG